MWFKKKSQLTKSKCGEITFDFYNSYYLFKCDIPENDDKNVYLTACFIAMCRIEKELCEETYSIVSSFLVNSMLNPIKNPDKYLYKFYDALEGRLTIKQLKEINTLGHSVTSIEVPLTETKKKPETPFITQCKIGIYKTEEGLETKYLNTNKKLDYILMPIVITRLFVYIQNILPVEDRDIFYKTTTDFID